MSRMLLIVSCVTLLGAMAYAELQQVEVGGEIRIRGRFWSGGFSGVRFNAMDPALFAGRPLGPFGISSVYDWDRSAPDRSLIEQRSDLYVNATFTDNVSAKIHLSDFGIWGEDFRSNYVTGVDNRAITGDDVEVYQAYIETKETFGLPVTMRVGRQEIVMDDGWLIANMVSPCLGISFDALRLTYKANDFSVDAFSAKLVETNSNFMDDDVDLYGVHAIYSGIKNLSLSGYWYFINDRRDIDDTPGASAVTRWTEDLMGENDYSASTVHTVGLHAKGKTGAFDYCGDVAYQFGEASQIGSLFKPRGVYGDDDAKYDNWAFDVESGYTFDVKLKPRIYVGGAYYGGEDNRDLSFLDWLNPFYKPQASVSFNRLFSRIWYTASTDILGGASAMTNFWQVRSGVTINATDAITTGVKLAYFWTDEPFDFPATVAGVPVPGLFSFWTKEGSDDIGLMTTLWAKYNYSKDWFIAVGWERLWAGDGITEGSYIFKNGLEFSGGTADDEPSDYLYVDTGLTF